MKSLTLFLRKIPIMAEKIKPCSLFKRHKWVWARNVNVRTGRLYASGAASVSITLKGRYLCECGETKLGAPAHTETQKEAA